MTAMLERTRAAAAPLPVGWLGRPRLLADLDRLELSDYRAATGPLPELSRDQLLALLDAVNLTGRGGAAFPLAAKIRSLKGRPVVLVNGTEGEPVSAKDHALLSRAPHLVQDGAEIVARALGARKIILAIADPALVPPLQQADRPRIELHRVADRFIAGEARALIDALNGGNGLPPGRRVLPTVAGIDGKPTLLSNAETFAQVALLARLGPAIYSGVGTASEPGTALLSVSGAVAKPGVLEVPFGTRVSEIVRMVGASSVQAVVTGGYHGTWLPPVEFELSRQGVFAVGGSFGAGVLVFLDEHTCPLAELTRVASWLAGESARQCGPCQFGLPALVSDLQGLLHGQRRESQLLRRAAQLPGRGACAHPDGAVRFIQSGLAVLAEEVAVHQHRGGCGRADLGQLATHRADAFGAAA